ncbi:MAG: OprO/OprP family phosphate-selective porin [Deltaproteobacteria bacterium]|nr:OprO/OprP family phosphate-selective porin [Deltaproteobacteria bacterium]
MLKKIGFVGISVVVGFILSLPVSLWASNATGADEVEALRDEIRVFQERLQKLEKKQAGAEKTPRMKAYWKNGFRIEYDDPKNDQEYKFRFRTGIQFRYTYVDTDDDILYNGSPTGKNVDHTENYSSFSMRRLRFFIDGTAPTPAWKYLVHLQLEPQSAVNVHDAFIQWQQWKEFRIQFGRMKVPAFGIEYWQSGFGQNGTDRTIFTGDSEFDKDLFGNRIYDFPGSNARLRVGGHRQKNGFPTGGFLLYRSQGFNINGYLDMLGQKDFLTYWLGVYDGRDTRGYNNADDEMLYTFRLGMNFLPGSDPKGPMGSKAFKNYFAQSDYGYNTEPLASLILSGFRDKDKTGTSYTVSDDPAKGFMGTESGIHDIENYGFSGTLLFRYLGFSSDFEYACEKFIQNGIDSETWRRWGARLNLGYFIVPKKWELTAKLAYVERLRNNDLEDSIKSGLGLVKLNDGFAVEDNLQQYVLGINHYLHGFNQYITADICLNKRHFDEVCAADAAAFGLDPASFSKDPDCQDDIRFRVMYQHFF